MSSRVDRGLTLGFAGVIVLLLIGLGPGGDRWVWAGILVTLILVVIGAISLGRGGRMDVADPDRVGGRAAGAGDGGLGSRDRVDGPGLGARRAGLGSEQAWRAWLDEVEKREK